MPKVLSKYESPAGRRDTIGSPWIRPEYALNPARRRLVFGKTPGNVKRILAKWTAEKTKKERQAKLEVLEQEIMEAKFAHCAAIDDMEKEELALQGTELTLVARRRRFNPKDEQYVNEGKQLANEFKKIYSEIKQELYTEVGPGDAAKASDLEMMVDNYGMTKPHSTHFVTNSSISKKKTGSKQLLSVVEKKLSSIRLVDANNAQGTTPLFKTDKYYGVHPSGSGNRSGGLGHKEGSGNRSGGSGRKEGSGTSSGGSGRKEGSGSFSAVSASSSWSSFTLFK